MDVLKLMYLLENASLWFARADLLDDPREGRLTDAELCHLKALGEGAERHIDLRESSRRECFVNCWYASESESMAMWELYGKGCGSIAVRSSVGAVKAALNSVDRSVSIGYIQYVDWVGKASLPNNVYGMLVRKIESYKHESEVRLLMWDPNAAERWPESVHVTWVANRMADELRVMHWEVSESELQRVCQQAVFASSERGYLEAMPKGIPLKIEIESLVEELVVGPDQPSWVVDVLRALVSRFGLSKSVRPSSLTYRA
jgi:hypothetical protein